MENQIDEFFKERLKEAESHVQPDTWFRLQDNMKQRQVYRRKIYGAAAMLIFTMVAGFWLLLQPVHQDVVRVVSESVQAPSIQPKFKDESKNSPIMLSGKESAIDGEPKSHTSQVSKPQTNDTEKAQAIETIAIGLPEQDVLSNLGSFGSEINSLEDMEISENRNDPEVTIYELEPSQENNVNDESKGRLIKAVMDWKREGVSFDAVRGIKNDLFNRLARIRQRSENRELKFETTEQ